MLHDCFVIFLNYLHPQSCSLFSPFSILAFWYFILHIFLPCQLSLTRSGLSIYAKFPVMPLSPYVHSILISNENSKSFPFKALCSFVYSVTLHSPLFLKLKIAFHNLPLHTTSAFCNTTCLKLQVKPFLVLCSKYKS